MYCMMGECTGADFAAIVRSARERFHWIWRFDLATEVRCARESFMLRVGGEIE
jgi:hypothetical protein